MDENPYRSPESSWEVESNGAHPVSGEYVPSLVLEIAFWILSGLLAMMAFTWLGVAITDGVDDWQQLLAGLGLFVMLAAQVVITVRAHRSRTRAARCA